MVDVIVAVMVAATMLIDKTTTETAMTTMNMIKIVSMISSANVSRVMR